MRARFRTSTCIERGHVALKQPAFFTCSAIRTLCLVSVAFIAGIVITFWVLLNVGEEEELEL